MNVEITSQNGYKNIEIRFNKKIIVNGGITMLVVHSLFLDIFFWQNLY